MRVLWMYELICHNRIARDSSFLWALVTNVLAIDLGPD